MMWIKTFARLILMIVTPFILFVPTIYATVRKLDRLPWGFNYIFGCKEDGWNGTGCDPEFLRKFWRNVDGETMQGWYPDHLGLIWSDLSLFKQWWHGFVWCAFRNVAWNLRLTDWFGTSVHWKDIRIVWIYEDKTSKEMTVYWLSKNGTQHYHKRRLFLGKLIEFGYEFPFDLFDDNHPWFKRVRNEGYTFDVTPFKDRSMPSFRPRSLK
jgi:hypothetical protein